MRHCRRSHRAYALVAVMFVGLLIPSNALAYYWDGLDVWAYDSASVNTIAGAAGNARIPSSYNVLYQHVSSIYCYEEGVGGDEMVEIGWVAEPPTFGNTDPYYFEAYIINGTYITWPTSGSSGKVKLSRGTNPRFSVRPSSVGSTTWNFYLNGTLQHQRVVPFNAGTPEAASERDGTEDTNWSYFTDLRKCSRLTGDWWDWHTLALGYDGDPWYHWNKVNDQEFSVTAD